MFFIKNVPIVIEPGVQAIEAELVINHKKYGQTSVPVQLVRLVVDEKASETLPFIATTALPHVFSLVFNVEKAAALVVYDAAGRISTIYTKDETQRSWERFSVSDEHAGKSVTQFSVRYIFNTAKDRSKFLTAMEKLTEQAGREELPNMADVMAALRPLARTRTAPVVLPVAVEKCNLSKIKL